MVFASNNSGKLEEIRKIFGGNILSLSDKGIFVDVVEDGNTFYDNAKKKALEIYNLCGEPVIADDSGLCINCLDGFPGVNTARFLGDVRDEDRNNYILKEVNLFDDLSAYVVCCLVYYDGVELISFEGILEGNISNFARGSNGFGFDSIFEIDGVTLAEMSVDEKNLISARRNAVVGLKSELVRKGIL